jgi:hypothetical protein
MGQWPTAHAPSAIFHARFSSQSPLLSERLGSARRPRPGAPDASPLPLIPPLPVPSAQPPVATSSCGSTPQRRWSCGTGGPRPRLAACGCGSGLSGCFCVDVHVHMCAYIIVRLIVCVRVRACACVSVCVRACVRVCTPVRGKLRPARARAPPAPGSPSRPPRPQRASPPRGPNPRPSARSAAPQVPGRRVAGRREPHRDGDRHPGAAPGHAAQQSAGGAPAPAPSEGRACASM